MKKRFQGFSSSNSTALARFRILNFVAFLTETTGVCLHKALKQTSERTWPDQNGKMFAVRTIEDWWYNYARKGFDALVPKVRSDRGMSSVLSEEDRIFLKAVSEDHPGYTARQIYTKLVEQRVPEKVACYSSVLRYLNSATRTPTSDGEHDDNIRGTFSSKQHSSLAEELLTLGKALPSADNKRAAGLNISFRCFNWN